MASYELRIGDTYPNIPVLLTDNSGTAAIDLTNASSVTYRLKGVTAPEITGVCSIGQKDITGTATSSSTSMTSVSPTTGYANGATINGTGVSTTIASGAGSSTLTLAAAATSAATGSPGTFFVSMGLVYITFTAALVAGFTTADTYTGQCVINWAAGGIQTVPNAYSGDFTILVDQTG